MSMARQLRGRQRPRAGPHRRGSSMGVWLGIGGGVLGVGVLTAGMVLRSRSRPRDRLQRELDNMGEGDLEDRIGYLDGQIEILTGNDGVMTVLFDSDGRSLEDLKSERDPARARID